MRKSPILSLVVFFTCCGLGGGCIATPNPIAQVSPKLPSPIKTTPPKSTTPLLPKKPGTASPFVPGVVLPVFPGSTPIPSSATVPSLPTATTPAAPMLPLVEVPTPGLRAVKIKNAGVSNSTVQKRRRIVNDETPTPVRRRLKRSVE